MQSLDAILQRRSNDDDQPRRPVERLGCGDRANRDEFRRTTRSRRPRARAHDPSQCARRADHRERTSCRCSEFLCVDIERFRRRAPAPRGGGEQGRGGQHRGAAATGWSAENRRQIVSGQHTRATEIDVPLKRRVTRCSVKSRSSLCSVTGHPPPQDQSSPFSSETATNFTAATCGRSPSDSALVSTLLMVCAPRSFSRSFQTLVPFPNTTSAKV